ncbi:MAG: flagellar assembly protein FliW [bacterium]|nr:MAG: flagellar assembly protein FliW [bacterium]
MLVENLFIGDKQISEQEIIHFPYGIIGLENYTKFMVVENPNFKPFCWLISLDQKDFAIPVVNPFLLMKEYRMQFPLELTQELRENSNCCEVFCTVSPKGEQGSVTLNLKGPILIDYLKREGRQVILNSDILSISYPLN